MKKVICPGHKTCKDVHHCVHKYPHEKINTCNYDYFCKYPNSGFLKSKIGNCIEIGETEENEKLESE